MDVKKLFPKIFVSEHVEENTAIFIPNVEDIAGEYLFQLKEDREEFLRLRMQGIGVIKNLNTGEDHAGNRRTQ